MPQQGLHANSYLWSPPHPHSNLPLLHSLPLFLSVHHLLRDGGVEVGGGVIGLVKYSYVSLHLHQGCQPPHPSPPKPNRVHPLCPPPPTHMPFSPAPLRQAPNLSGGESRTVSPATANIHCFTRFNYETPALFHVKIIHCGRPHIIWTGGFVV